MTDRYTKSVLTVIAGALIYLCVVMTPWPAASAQTARTPGESTGPAQVVLVGSRLSPSDAIPVSFEQPVAVRASAPLPVTGRVTTERSSNVAERVVLVGWEEGGTRERMAPTRSLSAATLGLESIPALPVVVVPPK
jgi:hypothetical protein